MGICYLAVTAAAVRVLCCLDSQLREGSESACAARFCFVSCFTSVHHHLFSQHSPPSPSSASLQASLPLTSPRARSASVSPPSMSRTMRRTAASTANSCSRPRVSKVLTGGGRRRRGHVHRKGMGTIAIVERTGPFLFTCLRAVLDPCNYQPFLCSSSLPPSSLPSLPRPEQLHQRRDPLRGDPLPKGGRWDQLRGHAQRPEHHPRH